MNTKAGTRWLIALVALTVLALLPGTAASAAGNPPVFTSPPSSFTVEANGPTGHTGPLFSVDHEDPDGDVDEVRTGCEPHGDADFPFGETTVNCVVTDDQDNTAEHSFTVTVVDTTAPRFGPITSHTIEATSPAGATFTYSVSAIDDVDQDVDLTCSPASGSLFPVGTTEVSCTATDDAGNAETTGFGVTVTPDAGPWLHLPGDMVVEAITREGTPMFFIVFATDAVDGDRPVYCDRFGSMLPPGTWTVTCSASDLEGNVTTGTFDVTVVDTTPPAITPHDDQTAEATGPLGAIVFTGWVSVWDAVDPFVFATCLPTGPHFPVGITTVICTATDRSGNSSTMSYTVTVTDSNAPEFIATYDDVTVEAEGPAGTVVDFVPPWAWDQIDVLLFSDCSPAPSSTFPIGATTVACTAADRSGNSAATTFTVTVQDTTAPVLNALPDITVEATGPAGAPATFDPVATDLADANPDISCAPASGTTFALGSTTVTCTAVDDSGNASPSASFAVNVVDTTAPVFDDGSDRTTEATSPAGAYFTNPPVADDDVSGPSTVTCVPAAGGLLTLGTTEVTCTASDIAGNSAEATFGITVVDTTAPDLTVPADISVPATTTSGATVHFDATATDVVTLQPTVECAPGSGSTFPIGETEVTCTARDGAGNTATDTFTIRVTDADAPVLDLPDDQQAEATGAEGAVVGFTATATDDIDDSPTVVCSPASASTFALGTTTVECTATDSGGNESTGSFDITVVDTTDPVLGPLPDLDLEATSPDGVLVLFAAEATDTVDPAVTVTCSPLNGTPFPMGTTEVSCTATDDAGNTTTASFDVTVADTTPPVLTAPDDFNVAAIGPDGAGVTYEITATDVADVDLTVSCLPASGSVFAIGETLVSCTATDDAANMTSATFRVTVADDGAPTLFMPADQLAEATGPDGAIVSFVVTATDDLDPFPAVACLPTSGSTFALGTTTVNCTATDSAGNTSAAGFELTVVDTTAPVIVQPSDITAEAPAPDGATVTYDVTAHDLVDGTTVVVCNPPSGSLFPVGATAVTCTATDTRGTQSSATFSVTVTGPVTDDPPVADPPAPDPDPTTDPVDPGGPGDPGNPESPGSPGDPGNPDGPDNPGSGPANPPEGAGGGGEPSPGAGAVAGAGGSRGSGPGPNSAPGSLVRTGVAPSRSTAFAAMLVLAGAALITTSRRRRTA